VGVRIILRSRKGYGEVAVEGGEVLLYTPQRLDVETASAAEKRLESLCG